MSPAPTRRNVLGLLGAFVVTAVVAGLLAAGLAMPAIGASGVATKNTVNLFDNLPSDLKQPPLAQTTKLEAADGSVIATFYQQNRQNVPLSAINLVMQKAIVAIEDSRFYEHGPVDPKGLLRALAVNKINGGIDQGASTLTQQYVKNVLEQNALAVNDPAGVKKATEQTTSRKLQEIRYAITVEKQLSKDQILDNYLNIAFFGDEAYGIQAAARHYFNVDASKLSLPQAALLAGMVQAPTQWNPHLHPADAVKRRDVVLARMYQLHVIDQPTYQAAVATKLKLHLTSSQHGCASAGYTAYFCQYVYEYIVKNNSFSALGATPDARETALNRDGLVIKTTLDPKIEKEAWLSSIKAIPVKDKSQDGTAAVTIQPGTGKVLAMAQNSTFLGNGNGASSINWSVDYEYGGSTGFPTGSSFKPFTLATWLKAGHSLNESVSAASQNRPYSAFKSCYPMSRYQSYNPNNSEGKGSGSISVLKATAASVNTAYVSMESQLNLCDIRATAESMGVYQAEPTRDICSLTSKLTVRVPACAPSLTLGVASLSPMTQAAAYATFAAQGTYCAPRAITSITKSDGTAVKVPGQNCSQAMDKKVANTVTYALTKVLQAGGTAARIGGLAGDHPAAGKTGTTNQARDTWFVGYTPQLATAVWVGDNPRITKSHPHRRALFRQTINGHYWPEVFGADIAAPSWKRIMDVAEANLPTVRFAAADSKLTEGATAGVPNVAGEKLSDAINDLTNAGFSTKTGGLVSSGYPAGRVAYTSPGAGSQVKQGTTVTISISSGSGGGNGGKNSGGGNGGGNNTGAEPGWESSVGCLHHQARRS